MPNFLSNTPIKIKTSSLVKLSVHGGAFKVCSPVPPGNPRGGVTSPAVVNTCGEADKYPSPLPPQGRGKEVDSMSNTNWTQ